MAIGFSNGSTTFVPDKGFSRKNTPVVFRAEFGDGYEPVSYTHLRAHET